MSHPTISVLEKGNYTFVCRHEDADTDDNEITDSTPFKK